MKNKELPDSRKRDLVNTASGTKEVDKEFTAERAVANTATKLVEKGPES